jgi:hypothetical protein
MQPPLMHLPCLLANQNVLAQPFRPPEMIPSKAIS